MKTMSQMAKDLMNNKDFQELVLKEFIEKGILTYTLEDNVDNESVRDELKARKILRDFLNYALDYDNIEQIKKQ